MKKENLNIKGENMSLNVLMLESVGSCIDTDNLVYPLDVNNNPCFDDGVHFSVTTDEWLGGLSMDDVTLMNDWVNQVSKCDKCGTHTAKVNYNDGNFCTWYCAKKGNK